MRNIIHYQPAFSQGIHHHRNKIKKQRKKNYTSKNTIVNMNNNNKIDTLRNDEQKNLHKPIMYTLKGNQLVHRKDKPTENINF